MTPLDRVVSRAKLQIRHEELVEFVDSRTALVKRFPDELDYQEDITAACRQLDRLQTQITKLS